MEPQVDGQVAPSKGGSSTAIKLTKPSISPRKQIIKKASSGGGGKLNGGGGKSLHSSKSLHGAKRALH